MNPSPIRKVQTAEAPPPGGHYTQGIVHQGTLYVSGQLPFAKDGTPVNGTIEEQTRQVLSNLEQIVVAAGSDKERILKVTVYLSDIELWSQVNQVYAEFFGDHQPARAMVPTKDLHHGFLIELEAIAAVDAS